MQDSIFCTLAAIAQVLRLSATRNPYWIYLTSSLPLTYQINSLLVGRLATSLGLHKLVGSEHSLLVFLACVYSN